MSGPDRIWIEHHEAVAIAGSPEWLCLRATTNPNRPRDVEYIRRNPVVLATLPEVQALIAEAVAKEREADAKNRPTFPILNSGGARFDLQLVQCHGGQAQKNHHQSVSRLAERGGLSWCELHAVLHDRRYVQMDANTAIRECRSLEALYLAAIRKRGEGQP